MRYGRTCGILLHVTSLPSRFGIGDLGPEAERLLRWLSSAGQRVWQILPLNPITGGGSPYTALSAFAGNPWLISPERLVENGYLDESEMPPHLAVSATDYPRVAVERDATLRRAWKRASSSDGVSREVDSWSQEQDIRTWIDDWALFATIRALHGGRSWRDWPERLRHRDENALDEIREIRGDDLRFHRFSQWLFHQQWGHVHRYAAGLGISIFGDAPIYVSWDSADVWAHPDRFLLDRNLEPTVVAGVPPDYFSETGQLWGNPIYDWKRMRRDGFPWWTERLRTNLGAVDVLRLDHFRAFAGYWEIPASETTAVDGRWKKGPGIELFHVVSRTLGELPLVAEDLGTITPDVEELLATSGFPGMKVMQFGFGEPDNIHLPHRYAPATIGYTGTHDNDTFLGWFRAAGERERNHAIRYLHARSEHSVVRNAIEALYQSKANGAIVPMQDVLELGSSARMNTPGTVEGNWTWRFQPDRLSEEDARRLARLARETGRVELMCDLDQS